MSYSYTEYSIYDSYENLITEIPEFVESNYFETDNFYYYLSKIELNSQSDAVVGGKLRLMTLSNLNESICCGFDISHMKRKSKEMDVLGTSTINNLEILLNDKIDTFYLYAVRIKKEDFKINNCTCNYTLN